MTVALPDEGREAAAVSALLGGALTAEGQPGCRGLHAALDLPHPDRTPSDPVDLGMTRAFGDRADFTPMSPHDPLYVKDVLHQAFIAVDEAGTEAAAATAVVMASSVGSREHTLTLDRPFLFVIHDTAHGTPLFVGRVADPS